MEWSIFKKLRMRTFQYLVLYMISELKLVLYGQDILGSLLTVLFLLGYSKILGDMNGSMYISLCMGIKNHTLLVNYKK